MVGKLKNMYKKIKSWYLIFTSIIIQAIFSIYWLYQIDFTPPRVGDDLASIQAVPFVFMIFSLIVMILMIVPMVLLIANNPKAKKVGAALSLFLGILIGLYFIITLKNYFINGGMNDSFINIFYLQVAQVFLLITAGLHFGKK